MTGRHMTWLPRLSLVQQTLRVDTASVQAMATRWGTWVGDLGTATTPKALGLPCQPSATAVDSAHAEVTAFSAALAARVDARAADVADADTHYIANETRSAGQLATVAHSVTSV